MATKKEKRSCGWIKPEMELTKEFDKQSFEKLIEYSDENMLNLMTIWLNAELKEVKRLLMLGTAKLSYFESSIAADPKIQAAFKLGELAGHLDCLNSLNYENDQNALAKARFATVRILNLENSKYFEDVIIIIAEKGIISDEELKSKVDLDSQKLSSIIKALVEKGLINSYADSTEYYSLSDMGIRLVKQLNKANKN